PLRAPSRGLEWVGKVLAFMRHFSIPKLHNTHGVDALAFVDNHVLSDPEIALSHDPADRKPRWPARMMTTKRLQVTPTANYLAWLGLFISGRGSREWNLICRLPSK